jgi:hypothetical protein
VLYTILRTLWRQCRRGETCVCREWKPNSPYPARSAVGVVTELPRLAYTTEKRKDNKRSKAESRCWRKFKFWAVRCSAVIFPCNVPPSWCTNFILRLIRRNWRNFYTFKIPSLLDLCCTLKQNLKVTLVVSQIQILSRVNPEEAPGPKIRISFKLH